MQIFVRADRTYTLDVESFDSVAQAKSLINAKTGFPAPSQRLIYSGLQLVDSRTLAVSHADDDGLVDYDISQDATVQLVFSLEGGAKKRKKKQYTTPKKIKHKHKKEKMATLKYYSVDSDGKIQRLRRECPSETCGAGIFMAFHKDRQYCGKCHTTYKLDKDDDE